MEQMQRVSLYGSLWSHYRDETTLSTELKIRRVYLTGSKPLPVVVADAASPPEVVLTTNMVVDAEVDAMDHDLIGEVTQRSQLRRTLTGTFPGRMKVEAPVTAVGGGLAKDESGSPKRVVTVLVGGRPRKTAEELDAEMDDYWGGAPNEAQPARNAAPVAAAAGGDDVDMIE